MNGWDVSVGGAYQGGLQFDPSTGGMYFGSSNTNDANFATSSNKLTILNSGQVGIGTVAPTTTLEVNGTVKATSFSVGPQIVNATCSNTAGSQCIVTATCPAGKTLLSGGYTTSWSAANVLQNYPVAGNAWRCAFYSDSSLGPHTCFALCANLQ